MRSGSAAFSLPRGVASPLASIDRIGEGLPVVALIYRLARPLQRGRGRRVLLRRVRVGASGARRIDRGLRLVDFFLRRLGARSQKRDDCDQQRTPCDPCSPRPERAERV